MWLCAARLIRALDTLRENIGVEHRVMELRKADPMLNDTFKGRSNNSFNASGNSAAFIENLNVTADASRPVNSGVMSPLRIDSKKLPAAPLLCD
jgi:hypothetical protein